MPGPKGYYGNSNDDWVAKRIEEIEFVLYQNPGAHTSSYIAELEKELERLQSY